MNLLETKLIYKGNRAVSNNINKRWELVSNKLLNNKRFNKTH